MIPIESRVTTGMIMAVALLGKDRAKVKDRENLCPVGEPLQVALRKERKGASHRAHLHMPSDRRTERSQEGWIVLSGEVVVSLWDTDGSPLTKIRLLAGDCLVVFGGAHEVQIVRDSVVYQVKNGPYPGAEKEKMYLL